MRSVRSPQSGRSGGRLAARAPFGWKVGWARPAAGRAGGPACAGGAEYICGAADAGDGPVPALGIGPEDDRAIGPEDDRAIGPELAPLVPTGAGRPGDVLP